MEDERRELDRCVNAIVRYAVPRKVLLFGSRAKGLDTEESDFDLCVLYDRLPKRKLEIMQDLYRSIFSVSDRAIDLVVYDMDSFVAQSEKKGTLASEIEEAGQVLYG